jgi:hypothetical protein
MIKTIQEQRRTQQQTKAQGRQQCHPALAS